MKPMLASKITDIEKLRFPLLASPKLDGIRCLVLNEQPYSRNMKLIPNTFVRQALTGLPPMDGELIVGPPTAKDVFNTTQSGVMSASGAPKFTFWVFDAVTRQPMPFKERLELARSYARSTSGVAKLVPHKMISSLPELLTFEQEMLAAGYEGVMLRDPEGPYKQGRSTEREGWLLKLKRFEDSEARVLGFEELQHNDNEQQRDELGRSKRSSAKAGKRGGGVLGALHVQDLASGVEFSIGSGFTSEQRAELWAARDELVGRVAQYRFQPAGVKEAPRFPVFMRFRDERDL